MWQQHKMPCSYQHSHFCCVMAMIDPAGGSVPNGPSLHHPGVFPVHGTKHGQGDDGHASNSTHQHHHGCRCRPDKCVPIASRNINSLSCIPAARQQHDMSVLVFFSLVVCGKGGVALLLNRMNPMSRDSLFLNNFSIKHHGPLHVGLAPEHTLHLQMTYGSSQPERC